MAGWGKFIAGALLGAAGTVYATNEKVRERLPEEARDLPDAVRSRFKSAVAAAREGYSSRRAEIIRDLDRHGGREHPARGVKPDPATPASRIEAAPPVSERGPDARADR